MDPSHLILYITFSFVPCAASDIKVSLYMLVVIALSFSIVASNQSISSEWDVELDPGQGVKLELEYEARFPGREGNLGV